jgi:hypothetical protein
MQYSIVNYRKARKIEDLQWDIELPDRIAGAFIEVAKKEKLSFWAEK